MKLIAFVLAIIFLLAACGGDPRQAIVRVGFDEIVYQPGTPFFHETTLEGLESRASNIVRGRIGNDAHTMFQFDDIDEPTRPQRGYTFVSLEITEVIKGDLAAGSTITIIEPYYIIDGTLYTRSHYLPSTPGVEYFFFLGSQLSDLAPDGFEGAYGVLHSERGRYLVTRNIENLQAYDVQYRYLGTRANVELYMRLWREVLEAYMR